MKTIQWNIGGGYICAEDADPERPDSYSVDGIDEIIDFLSKESADVITLQETHTNTHLVQAQQIAEKLGYKHWFNDIYDDSHLEDGQRLGQAVISKLPLRQHTFQLFHNPHYTADWDYGTRKIVSHDKGLTTVVAQLPDGTEVMIHTLHMIPFRPFNINPLSAEARPALDDVQRIVTQKIGQACLLQGDFNIDAESMKSYLPELFEGGYREILQTEITTPKGKRYDHILYGVLELTGSHVNKNVLTDHFPVIATFE